jgi:hypothetical protein
MKVSSQKPQSRKMASRAGISVSRSCDAAGWVDAPNHARTVRQEAVAAYPLRLAKMFTRGAAADRSMWLELGRGSVGTTRFAREAATQRSSNRRACVLETVRSSDRWRRTLELLVRAAPRP